MLRAGIYYTVCGQTDLVVATLGAGSGAHNNLRNFDRSQIVLVNY